MALIRATITSRFDLGSTTVEQFENLLDQKLAESGFESKGPTKYWRHSYLAGSRKEMLVSFRAQPGPDSTRLFLNVFPKNFNLLRNVTVGIGSLDFTLLLLYAAANNPTKVQSTASLTLFAILAFIPLSVILGVSFFVLRRMLRPDPTVSGAVRKARNAVFDELKLWVFVLEARAPLTYLDSLYFLSRHPLMIYVKQGVDRVAFVLSLILPVLAGIYLFVRREGGGFRLLLTILATPLQLFFLEYQLIIRESFQFAYVNIFFVLIVANFLAWVPLYQCGKCGFRYVDHRTISCPECKSKLHS